MNRRAFLSVPAYLAAALALGLPKPAATQAPDEGIVMTVPMQVLPGDYNPPPHIEPEPTATATETPTPEPTVIMEPTLEPTPTGTPSPGTAYRVYLPQVDK